MTELPQSEHPKEKLGDFMTTPVISIDVKARVQEAAYLMDTENASAILTTENGDHVGIVTERDFTWKVVGGGLPLSTPVSEIMSQPLYTLDINNHILEASEHMTDKNTRHITVTDQGKVVGIITVKNTFSYYMNLFGLVSYDPTTNADWGFFSTGKNLLSHGLFVEAILIPPSFVFNQHTWTPVLTHIPFSFQFKLSYFITFGAMNT